MSKIVELTFDDLIQGTDNYRKHYGGIPQIAESIAILGLLENLVVVPAKKESKYEVKAGNRRYLGIKNLLARGIWKRDDPIPCKVLTRSDGELEALAENDAREDVPPWETGARYLKLAENGMGQKEIAAAVGQSQQKVSLLIRLARDLSPKVVKVLSSLGSSRPNLLELGRIAEMRDADTLGPDEPKQMEKLKVILGTPKKPRSPTPQDKKTEVVVMKRFRILEDTPLPAHAEPYWVAFFRYLTGKDETLELPEHEKVPAKSKAKKKKKTKRRK